MKVKTNLRNRFQYSLGMDSVISVCTCNNHDISYYFSWINNFRMLRTLEILPLYLNYSSICCKLLFKELTLCSVTASCTSESR